jgi:hypothetical protein
MLAAVPDLRDALRRSSPEELADLLDAFDVTVTYDKANRSIELAAVVADAVPPPETQRPPNAQRAVAVFRHSGGTIWTHWRPLRSG